MSKNSLKLARNAFRSKDYQDVIKYASVALEQDATSIPALLILARTLELTNQLDRAESSYRSAASIQPNSPEAWLGLKNIYKSKGKGGVSKFTSACVKVAETRALTAKEEENVSQIVKQEISEAVDFAKQNGSRLQLAEAMTLFLPTSSLYSHFADLAPPPLQTWLEISDILERWENSTINKLIGERRTRIGATLRDVTAQTKNECFGLSNLDNVYQNIINWALDDTVRRQYEEKQFLRALEWLDISSSKGKPEAAEAVLALARGMVIIKYPYEDAWNINLEWRDGETLEQWDFELLLEFISTFPDTGLAKVLEGFLYSPLSPFKTMDESDENKKREKERGVNLRDTDARLEFMTDGLIEARNSIMAHRLMVQYFFYSEEYELAIKTGQAGLKLTEALISRTGTFYQHTLNGFNCGIATSYIHLSPPKSHPLARSIFQTILKTTTSHFGALSGMSQIFEAEGLYKEALEYAVQAHDTEPTDIRTKVDIAWCEAMTGAFDASLPKLHEYLDQIPVTTLGNRKLKILTNFRIGRCIWAMDPTRVGRKDRRGAYSWFLSTIKLDPSFAPAYTSLGVFYADYATDRKRGRQCFQKAFELSTEETLAAEYLAHDFADRQEWDVVELIANRAVDSGHALPPIGSNRKGLSWPFAALGVVNMNRADFRTAAIKFLAALRISPSDYHSYIGLAEAYHNSGRHNSALRSVLSAKEVASQKSSPEGEEGWFASYILGNIYRDIGQHDEAIAAYKVVLKVRPAEYGVQIALLQTIVEQGFSNLTNGLFGRVGSGMVAAINLALNVNQTATFNLWKAVGDACVALSLVQATLKTSISSVTGVLKSLFEAEFDTKQYELFSEVDKVTWATLDEQTDPSHKIMAAGILAYKRAIVISEDSVPSQAVGWFNLGCAEYQAYRLGQRLPSVISPSAHLRAAIRCFKRAIELESSNSDFWTALGITTSPLNSSVSQHAFIRALNINTRNAHAWTSLGSLYQQEKDTELAQMAFSRAISTEPEFAWPWVGAGMVEDAKGGLKAEADALASFTHALNIADQADVIVKKKFSISSFDALVKQGMDDLLRPLFALRQLSILRPQDSGVTHLRSLYLERVGEHTAAVDELFALCAVLEAEFENTEDEAVLARFCVAKAGAARNLLAVERFQEAREWAEEAVALIPEGNHPEQKLGRVRLSGLLTQGLAAYYEKDMSAALDAFRAALQHAPTMVSDSDKPGSTTETTTWIMCLLAEVLWAQGGVDERVVARESLEELVDGKEGWRPMVMVGVMALLEADEPAAKAVISDLEDLREKMVTWDDDDGMTNVKNAHSFGVESRRSRLGARMTQVENVLAALRRFVNVRHKEGSKSVKSKRTGASAGVLQDILAFPYRPSGWAELATEVELAQSSSPCSAEPSSEVNDGVCLAGTAPFVRQVAALIADQMARPKTEISVTQFAAHLAVAPSIEDRLAAVMLVPWQADGWLGLTESLKIQGSPVKA